MGYRVAQRLVSAVDPKLFSPDAAVCDIPYPVLSGLGALIFEIVKVNLFKKKGTVPMLSEGLVFANNDNVVVGKEEIL